MRQFSVPKEYELYRLDQFLANKLSSLSRSLIQKIIKSGKVADNGNSCTKASKQLAHNDQVQLSTYGREKVLSHFESDRVVSQYIALYRTLLPKED